MVEWLFLLQTDVTNCERKVQDVTNSTVCASHTHHTTKQGTLFSAASTMSQQTSSSSSESLQVSRSISELMQEIDPRMGVHPKVEEFVLELADDFLDNVASFSAQLAKHRRSNVIEARDIQLCLKKNWDIHVHGISSDSTKRKEANAAATSGHKPKIVKGKGSLHSQRLELKRQLLIKAARAAVPSTQSGKHSSKRLKRTNKKPPSSSSTTGL